MVHFNKKPTPKVLLLYREEAYDVVMVLYSEYKLVEVAAGYFIEKEEVVDSRVLYVERTFERHKVSKKTHKNENEIFENKKAQFSFKNVFEMIDCLKRWQNQHKIVVTAVFMFIFVVLVLYDVYTIVWFTLYSILFIISVLCLWEEQKN